MSAWINRSWIATVVQPLLRPVVQVALEPPPLGVAGGDQPLPRGLRSASSRWWSSATAAAGRDGFDQPRSSSSAAS